MTAFHLQNFKVSVELGMLVHRVMDFNTACNGARNFITFSYFFT